MPKNILKEKGIEVREMPVMPESYNEQDHSFEVIASTETPVQVIDWERWAIIDEVLLASGRNLPGNAEQVPLLDTHDRFSVESILGSAREWRTEKKNQTISRIVMSSTEEGASAEVKIREKHLTDVSVGYTVNKSVWVEENQSTSIEGKTFKGPIKVVTDWTVRELSLVPIGADQLAKFRGMRAAELGLPENASDDEIRKQIQQNNPQQKRKESTMDPELVKLQEQLKQMEARLAVMEVDKQTAKSELEVAKRAAEDIKEILSIAARYSETPGVMELAKAAVEDEKRSVQKFTLDVLEKVRTAPTPIPGKEQEIRVDGSGMMSFGVKPWQKRAVKYLNATTLEAKGQKERSALLFTEIRTEVSKMSDVQKNDELREAAQMIVNSGLGKMQQYRLLSSLSSAAGGALVPTPLLAEVFIEVEKWGVARRYFRPISMVGPGDTLNLDSLTTEAISYWVAQGDNITASDVAFGQTSLTVKKLAAITSWSSELPEDSAIALLPIVVDSIARAIRKKEDLAGFIGDGTVTYGSFTGMLNFAGKVTVMAAGKTAFSNADADDYRAVRDSVNIDFRDGAMWFLSPESVSGLEGLKDLQGNYIYRAPAAGLPAMLWGYPIADSVGINALTQTSAVSTKFAIFGNPQNILMGMKREIEFYASREGILQNGAGTIILNALQADAEILRATERVGFKGVRANSLGVLKTAAV
ncbi:MAG: phage major capsid protein [Bacteroidetes bacterium]|nr:phage major capsid protein [Bacteroidota bacterium]